MYGGDYNREKAYAEEIESQMAETNQAKYKTQAQPRTNKVDGASSYIEQETTGMRTGKLNTNLLNKWLLFKN